MDPYLDKLSEYLDGSLAARESEEVHSHLLVCSACRETLADLKRIKEGARALDELAPNEEVWKRVRAKIETTRPAATWYRSLLPIAAVLLLGITAAVLTLNLPRTEPPAQPAEPSAELTAVEQKYKTTFEGLEAIVKQDRAELDPKAAAALDTGLRVIDQAIDESKRATESQPDDPLARESLLEALQRKLTLLENTVMLLNDIRRGEVTGESLRGIQDSPKSPATKG